MRAFIAIELSEEIKSELLRIQANLKNCGIDIAWVKPDNIHLTLKFFKDIPDDKAEILKTSLEQFAITIERFTIKLTGAGAFPNLKYPRVVWAGLEECKGISDLYVKLEDILSNLGFEKESRPFHPHLTLGRIRTPKENTRLKEALSNTKVQPLTQGVSALSFFQSALTPQGPIYTLLIRTNLK